MAAMVLQEIEDENRKHYIRRQKLAGYQNGMRLPVEDFLRYRKAHYQS